MRRVAAWAAGVAWVRRRAQRVAGSFCRASAARVCCRPWSRIQSSWSFAERALDKPQAVFTRAAGRFAARLRKGCRVRRELLQGGRRFRIGPGRRERGFGAGEEGRFAPLLLRRQDTAVFPHGQGRTPLLQQLLRAGERVRAGRDAACKAGRAEGKVRVLLHGGRLRLQAVQQELHDGQPPIERQLAQPPASGHAVPVRISSSGSCAA